MQASVIPLLPPPISHYPHYCNTIARLLRNIGSPPDPPYICHTIYNIGHDNILKAKFERVLWGSAYHHLCWSLQDILSRPGFCARIKHPLNTPPACIAHTIAILLHGYCAIYPPPPNSPVYAIYHTILVMGMSCEGQGVSALCIITLYIVYR